MCLMVFVGAFSEAYRCGFVYTKRVFVAFCGHGMHMSSGMVEAFLKGCRGLGFGFVGPNYTVRGFKESVGGREKRRQETRRSWR